MSVIWHTKWNICQNQNGNAIPIPHINDGTPGHLPCLNLPPFIEILDLLTKLALYTNSQSQLSWLRRYYCARMDVGSNPACTQSFFKHFLRNLTKLAGDLNMANDLEYHHLCRESVQQSHSKMYELLLSCYWKNIFSIDSLLYRTPTRL